MLARNSLVHAVHRLLFFFVFNKNITIIIGMACHIQENRGCGSKFNGVLLSPGATSSVLAPGLQPNSDGLHLVTSVVMPGATIVGILKLGGLFAGTLIP